MSLPQQAIIMALIGGSAIVWLAIFRCLVARQSIVPFEPRTRVPWTGIDVLLLVLALPLLDGMVFELARSRGTLPVGELSLDLLASLTAARLMWSGLAIIYLEHRAGATAEDLGFDLQHLKQDARLGVLGFLAAILSVYGTEEIVVKLFPAGEHPLAKLVREEYTPALMVVAAISAIFVAPLAEELVFRVVLQGWLERQIDMLTEHRRIYGERFARLFAIVISAAAFAAMHRGYERIPIFVLGLILGYLYQQTHRIFPSLILHACFNGITILFLVLEAT